MVGEMTDMSWNLDFFVLLFCLLRFLDDAGIKFLSFDAVLIVCCYVLWLELVFGGLLVAWCGCVTVPEDVVVRAM